MNHLLSATLVAALAVIALICPAVPAQESPPSDAAIILEIQRLARPDVSIADKDKQTEALVANLRKIPPLVRELEKAHPHSQFLNDAYSLAINALLLVRQASGGHDLDADIRHMAARLQANSREEAFSSQALYVLLTMDAQDAFIAASQPAASAPAGSQPASRLADVAGRMVALADKYPRSTEAPAALYTAAGIYLQIDHTPPAVAALERLAHDYPKDQEAMEALMILVQLHQRAGDAKAVAADKQRFVEQFPDSPVTLKYRADLAAADKLGGPVNLRFQAADGRQVDLAAWRGKKVLILFHAGIAPKGFTDFTTGVLKELEALAASRGYALAAVGPDDESAAAKVTEILHQKGIAAPDLIDPEGKAAQAVGVTFLPSVAVVGEDGKLQKIISGGDLMKQVKAELAAASAPTTKP